MAISGPTKWTLVQQKIKKKPSFFPHANIKVVGEEIHLTCHGQHFTVINISKNPRLTTWVFKFVVLWMICYYNNLPRYQISISDSKEHKWDISFVIKIYVCRQAAYIDESAILLFRSHSHYFSLSFFVIWFWFTMTVRLIYHLHNFKEKHSFHCLIYRSFWTLTLCDTISF